MSQKLILRVKSTGQFCVHEGITMTTKSTPNVGETRTEHVRVLGEDYELTDTVLDLHASELEVLDPQPYQLA
jgi:hypothetical protein